VSTDKHAAEVVAEQVVVPLGVELLEAKWIGPRTQRTLRLVVDSEGGVSADICAAVTQQFDLVWEAEEAAPRDFGLEVTSPGPNRPLVTERDFNRVAGKWVEVVYRDNEANRVTVLAQVDGAAEGILRMTGLDDVENIPLDDIERAKVVFTIGKPPTPKRTLERRQKSS